MKKVLLTSMLLLIIIGCGNKQSKGTQVAPLSTEVQKDSVVDVENSSETYPSNADTMKQVIADIPNGILFPGDVRLTDSTLEVTGKLNITQITPIKIIGKSSRMYNIGTDTDLCDQAYLVDINYQDTLYTAFGKDVFETENNEVIFNISTESGETVTIFSVIDADMGAANEEGLTGCEESRLLLLRFNGEKERYTLIDCDEEKFGTSCINLFRNEGKYDKVYGAYMQQDTLVINILSEECEGGYFFNLKVGLSTDSPQAVATDSICFKSREEFEQYKASIDILN